MLRLSLHALARLLLFAPALVLAWLLLAPAGALAAAGVPSPNNELVLSGVQVWAAIAGSLVPAAGYLLNTYAPWASEPVKALVQVALAGIIGAITQLLDAGTLALDLETLQVIGTAVVFALLAHKALWLPSGLAAVLGSGQNRNQR